MASLAWFRGRLGWFRWGHLVRSTPIASRNRGFVGQGASQQKRGVRKIQDASKIHGFTLGESQKA